MFFVGPSMHEQEIGNPSIRMDTINTMSNKMAKGKIAAHSEYSSFANCSRMRLKGGGAAGFLADATFPVIQNVPLRKGPRQ